MAQQRLQVRVAGCGLLVSKMEKGARESGYYLAFGVSTCAIDSNSFVKPHAHGGHGGHGNVVEEKGRI